MVSAFAAAVALGALTIPPTQSASASAPPAPPPDSAFQKVTLNDHPGEPIDLAVLPDSRVLHTTRNGQVWLHDPDTGLNTLAAQLDVYQHDEEGLQSVAVDPNFSRDHWVYLYYSPPLDTPLDDPDTPDVNEGDAPNFGTDADWQRFRGHIQLSRFKLEGNELDLSTEQKILQVPVDRGICCHVGGDIAFDGHGNLLLSTGDDTNPFASDGYAPIDERPDRNPAYDAQRSAANTNDLRGKVLRITPKPGGGYTVPEGNLFAPGTPKTRPEIYVMGLRNPFRIEYDRQTDRLFVGDYSPDAGKPDPARGPAGTGRWIVVQKAGNYGWPYCATPDMPYVDYDFATGESGQPFDCQHPVNESPHNTGLTQLPPVQAPDVWYHYSKSDEFPELGSGGIGPMGGPVYHFDARNRVGAHPVGWPKYYDGAVLFGEWTRDWIKAMRLDDQGHLTKIEPVISSIATDNPMDMEFGPDGALYLLEYGDGYFSENPEAQVSRIDFIGENGNHTPVPKVSATPDNGKTPLTVQFSSDGTSDADGDELLYAWDFDADGTVDSREPNPQYTYSENGVYRATLKVTDVGGLHRGKSASADVQVVVGNQRPVVTLVKPVEGQPFQFGDTVDFQVTVTDDQPVDCDKVTVTYILGHDQHGHPMTTAAGCTGSITTSVPSGHDPATDDLSAVFVASYTDPGGDGLPQLTGTDQVVLHPTQ
jgi:glucose/arabinose dehydrogenase